MPARFRIRTKEGQELSFASQEIFAEFVRSGDLSPDDVVYDADTREWSSARTHPVVLQIQVEAEEDAPGEDRGASGPEREKSGVERPRDREGSGEGLDLDLAPAPAGLTPEEEAAAFVAKMEAERESERDFDNANIQGFRMEKGSTSIVEDLAPTPRPAASQEPPQEPPQEPRAESPKEKEPAKPSRDEPRRERRERPRDWSAAAPRREAPTAVPAPPKRKRAKSARRKYGPLAILGVVALTAGIVLGPELLAPGAEDGTGAEPEQPVEPPPPLIPATDEALRTRARELFLTSTQAVLRSLDPIPEIWLTGSYLAAPSDFPAVREVWDEYRMLIPEVRSGDDERYRQAYERALADARVQDTARTARLAAAMAAFRSGSAPRTAHWDRVEALATVAVQGHEALVGAEGTIAYQPATGPALSEDPVIEAVGRSPEAQTFLNQVLDLILAELHGEQGPGETGIVREWVWTGFLDAVTS